MFLNRGEDEVIEAIEARIQKHTALNKDNGEGLQILHYRPDEEYRWGGCCQTVHELWRHRMPCTPLHRSMAGTLQQRKHAMALGPV
jgi:hypothetical protein